MREMSEAQTLGLYGNRNYGNTYKDIEGGVGPQARVTPTHKNAQM